MLPPSYLDQMPDAFVQLWQQVEEQILQDVARRIGKMNAVTPTANWQLWRYQQTEALRNDVVKLLAKYTGKSETAIRKLLLQAATEAMEREDPPCSRRRTTNTRRTRTPKSKISFMEMPYFNHCMLSKRHNSGFFMPF